MSAILTARTAKDMPAGTVIQTKYVEERGEPDTTLEFVVPFTTSQGALLFTVALTPLLSNSKILLRGSGSVSTYMQPAPIGLTGGAILFFAGSTFLAGAYPYTYTHGDAVKWVLQYLYTPGAGATTYTVRFGCIEYPTKATSIYINGYTYGNTSYNPVTSFTLEEIRQ